MRGGLSIEQILYDTDLEDHEIISNIIKDNIENTKSSKMPLIELLRTWNSIRVCRHTWFA